MKQLTDGFDDWAHYAHFHNNIWIKIGLTPKQEEDKKKAILALDQKKHDSLAGSDSAPAQPSPTLMASGRLGIKPDFRGGFRLVGTPPSPDSMSLYKMALGMHPDKKAVLP